MKKLMLMFAFAAMCATNVMAQTPWKIVDMEYVTRQGGNCSYDDETCTATFRGQYDRWIDLPELKGDLSEHKTLSVTVLKSNVVLSFNIRYRDDDGNMKQVNAQTFYSTMGKEINGKKTFKVDLSNKGKISDDILKKVEDVRVAMARPVPGTSEPWVCQFGDIVVE